MSCQTPKCGQRQSGPGHPKSGWYNVHVTGDKGVWFCSYECVGRAFGAIEEQELIAEQLKPHEALQYLNRLARRNVTVYDVTPAKIRRMLELAFERLVDHHEADIAGLGEERVAS